MDGFYKNLLLKIEECNLNVDIDQMYVTTCLNVEYLDVDSQDDLARAWGSCI